MAQSIPKRKLVIGIPTYGSEYVVTPLDNGGYGYAREWTFNPRYATDLAASLRIPPTRNQAGEVSFVYTPTSTPAAPLALGLVQTASAAAFSTTTPFRLLWWSDAQAAADKVALARRLGIRGVAFFKFDGGEDPNIWGILPRK